MTEGVENNRSLKLSEISAIHMSTGTPIFERADIKDLVEPPLVRACEELYDKNVETVVSSANRKDPRMGRAYVGVAKNSLSRENLAIAEEIAASEEHGILYLDMPVDDETAFGDVEDMSLKIASRFHKQNMNWCQRLTLDQMKAIYGIKPEDDDYDKWTMEDFVGQTIHYYDPETNLFFLSEEQCLKYKEALR